MYAEVELTKEIELFITETQSYNESWSEIKELIFTTAMKKKNYSVADILTMTLQFQNIKRNTYYKVLHKQKLNYIEGMLIERLIAKYNGHKLMSIDEHLKQIEQVCIDITNENKLLKLLKSIIKLIKKI